jgi:TRAP-type C4-dicarboxylate transport system permease small subunit
MTGRVPPRWIARALELNDRLAYALGYIGGAVFVLLAFFITIDVLGRRYGGPYTGATDEIAVFANVLAATWALSFTAALGKHIRIDLVLHWFSPPIRRIADFGGIALLSAFAALLAINSWLLAYESFTVGAVSMSKLAIPLVYPQSAMAAGFTILTIHAAVMLLASPYKDLEEMHDAHRNDANQIVDI